MASPSASYKVAAIAQAGTENAYFTILQGQAVRRLQMPHREEIQYAATSFISLDRVLDRSSSSAPRPGVPTPSRMQAAVASRLTDLKLTNPAEQMATPTIMLQIKTRLYSLQ
jgi:hypothetical protein